MTNVLPTLAEPPPGEDDPADPMAERPFPLAIGWASAAAPGKSNEDHAGVSDPDPDARISHGTVVAVADGLGGVGTADRAARIAVDMVLQDYYGTSSQWPPSKALDRVLRACNDWLHAQNERRRDSDGLIASLSVVVFRRGRFHLAHVGDTRIYRVREGACKQITTDHVWPRHDMRHVPKRAMGLDGHIVVDYADGDLRSGDRFALLSDGVWEVLGEPALASLLIGEPDPQVCADRLVASAMNRQAAYMGRNDATALVVRVD